MESWGDELTKSVQDQTLSKSCIFYSNKIVSSFFTSPKHQEILRVLESLQRVLKSSKRVLKFRENRINRTKVFLHDDDDVLVSLITPSNFN